MTDTTSDLRSGDLRGSELSGSDFPGSHLRGLVQWAGLVGGPLLAWSGYLLLPAQYLEPDGVLVSFSPAGRITLAIMLWMATWWITEAVDISVTSLLPLVLFPLLGVASMADAAAPFSNPLIYLFMGGFMISIAMQQWGLDRRIALITLSVAGTRPPNMVAGFMLTTAGLSAFVSNTATTAMMVPIAMSVIQLVRANTKGGQAEEQRYAANLSICLMLGIAYAASIGGMATIIGTPPNAWLVGFASESFHTEITFVRWLAVGLPVTLLFLPITWFLLTRVLFLLDRNPIRGGSELIRSELHSMGRVNRGEQITLVVFALTAIAWIGRPLLAKIQWSWNGATIEPATGLTDAGIAMTGALALFVIPVDIRRRVFVLNWPAARKLPWGILVLFGGGLSLAGAVKANGVAEFIGSLSHYFAAMPPVVIVLAVTAMVIFLTELTSNAATTATLLPILAALAPGLGLDPFLLILPATIAASCAFMMPVATPPNAIVFGSGEVRIPHMAKAGIWLNLIGIGLITALTMFWYAKLFSVP